MATTTTDHNITNSTTSEKAPNDDDDAFLDDKLPYVIGGVTIACIIIALVVAVVLWKKARPCGHARWDVEHNTDKCNGVRLRIIERKDDDESSRVLKIHQPIRRTAGGPHSLHPQAGCAPRSRPDGEPRPDGNTHSLSLDRAPDIIKAHDSESVYETTKERQSARSMPGHMTPVNDQSRSMLSHVTPATDQSRDRDDGGSSIKRSERVNVAADVVVSDPAGYDHLVNSQMGLSVPSARNSGETNLRDTAPHLPSPPPPPLPPKPRTVRYPDGSLRVAEVKNGREHGAAANSDLVTSETRVLSPEDSLGTVLEKLGLRVCGSGDLPLVCQLTVTGVMDQSGEIRTLHQSDSKAVFLLQPYGANSNPENFAEKPASSPSQHQGRDKKLGEDRGCSTEKGKRGYFILEPPNHRDALPRQNSVMPHSPVPCPNYCAGRRCSLQSHQAQCSRNSIRRFSENASTLHGLGNSSLISLPTLPSTGDWFLSPKTTDYARSFSSPQSGQNKPSFQDAESSDKKLDALALKARIQREMQNLGFTEERAIPNSRVATTETTRSQPQLRFALRGNGDTSGESGGPSQNDYFILEPESSTVEEHTTSDSDDSAFDNITRPRVVVKPTLSRGMNPTDPNAGGKVKYHRQPGLPPRPPQRAPRFRGHIRSRSETPMFQRSGFPRGEGSEDEEQEQGPVIVSLRKLRSATMVTRPAPEPADGPEEASRRPSFRPRIMSEPGY